LSAQIDTIKAIYKNFLLRKWCSANNYYSEVLEFGDNNKDEVDNMLEMVSDHLTSTMRNSDKLLNIMQKFKLAVNKDLENVTGEGSTDISSNNSSESSGEEKGDSEPTDDDLSLEL